MATDEECAALAVFDSMIRAERLPDDPPIPVEEMTRVIRNIPPVVDISIWTVRAPDRSEVVAAGNVRALRTEENQHVVFFDI